MKDQDNVGGNKSGDGNDGGDVGDVGGDGGGDVGDVGGDAGGDVGDHQSPAELERLHPPVPVQTVLLPLVGSMPLAACQPCERHDVTVIIKQRPSPPLQKSMV